MLVPTTIRKVALEPTRRPTVIAVGIGLPVDSPPVIVAMVVASAIVVTPAIVATIPVVVMTAIVVTIGSAVAVVSVPALGTCGQRDACKGEPCDADGHFR